MSAVVITLPGPVGVRVKRVEGSAVEFVLRDAGHADAFCELLSRAQREGYAVRLSLIHYEGEPCLKTNEKRARKNNGKSARGSRTSKSAVLEGLEVDEPEG